MKSTNVYELSEDGPKKFMDLIWPTKSMRRSFSEQLICIADCGASRG